MSSTQNHNAHLVKEQILPQAPKTCRNAGQTDMEECTEDVANLGTIEL